MAKAQQWIDYIPRSVLFSPSEVLAAKISPDSKFIAYVKGEQTGTMNIHICATHECKMSGALKQITHFSTPEIYRYFWTGDSKSIVFLRDSNGSKQYDLYSIEVPSGKLVNHTDKFKGITAKIFKVAGPRVAVGINDRNPKYHDVFILDISTGSLQKIFENDRFSRFTLNDDLKISFKEEVHDDGEIYVFRDDSLIFHFSPEQAFHAQLVGIQKSSLYYLDSRNSNTTQLKEFNLKTGKEEILAHDDKSDIGDILFVDGKPVLYSTTWLKKKWHNLGEVGSAEEILVLQKELGSSFEIVSQSRAFWVIRQTEPKRIGASFYLYQLDQKQLTALFRAPTHSQMADMIPFEFRTRDGLTLTAYITLPSAYKDISSVKKPIPLVVLPHGGPFQARDFWTYNPYHQWLASRGYAVLSVNFRLSSGLGNQLVNAGNGEWGRKALFDLNDGVKWCIEKNITTANQVGIMGGSYGGYSTLAGLTFTPKEFAVGVDIVGPSSLITVMQKVPKYWDFPHYPLSDKELFFTRGAFIKSMGGSPDNEEGRKFLASRSPLNFATQIQRPLLIIQGDNDPIVTKEESQQIFNELNRLKKQSLFLSFSDEGHQFKRYANIDVYLAYAEKWLHDSLGGQFEPLNPDFVKESSVRIQKTEPPVVEFFLKRYSAFTKIAGPEAKEAKMFLIDTMAPKPDDAQFQAGVDFVRGVTKWTETRILASRDENDVRAVFYEIDYETAQLKGQRREISFFKKDEQNNYIFTDTIDLKNVPLLSRNILEAPIRNYGDPILSQPAKSVSDFKKELPEICSQIEVMKKTMRKTGGVGVSANQCADIKVPYRLVLTGIDYDDPESVRNSLQRYPGTLFPRLRAFINPKLIDQKGRSEFYEGCLSLRGPVRASIRRPESIRISYVDLHGDQKEESLSGPDARVMLHELDHINSGKLFFDYALAEMPSNQRAQVKTITQAILSERSQSTESISEFLPQPRNVFFRNEDGKIEFSIEDLKESLNQTDTPCLKGILNAIE